MIDIVTVVFREELPILRVQAESIDLYCQDIGIQNIFVVVNDTVDLINDIDVGWWGSLSNCVRIVHRDQVGCLLVENGWVSQQVLKVLGSSLSENQFSMILDAKTIIVKSATLQLLLPDGKPIGGGHPIPDVFYPSASIVEKLFNVKLTHNGGLSGVPFMFHNNTIRSMLTEIKSRTGQEFADWFQEQGMVTEYLLYVGYNLHLHGTMDQFYSLTYPYSVTNLCRSQTGIIEEKLIEMQHKHNLTVSVHRYAWAVMSEQQRNTYKKLLGSRNIKTALDLK